MREERDRLHHLLEAVGQQFAHQYCKNDGRREVDEQLQNVEPQRVEHNVAEVGVGKECFKLLETCPRAVLDYLLYVDDTFVFFEREGQSVQRRIGKHGKEHNTERSHKHQRPVVCRPTLFARFVCRGGYLRAVNHLHGNLFFHLVMSFTLSRTISSVVSFTSVGQGLPSSRFTTTLQVSSAIWRMCCRTVVNFVSSMDE